MSTPLVRRVIDHVGPNNEDWGRSTDCSPAFPGEVPLTSRGVVKWNNDADFEGFVTAFLMRSYATEIMRDKLERAVEQRILETEEVGA